MSRSIPQQPGLALDVPRSAAARPRRSAGGRRSRPHCAARRHVGERRPHDGDCDGDGDHRRRLQLRDVLRRGREPHPQRPARRPPVDGKLIAPGATFSFNQATGERTAAKGFLEAPVIINGELSTGLGGGVCQVSTTVFNAAYEAGLPITARTNHALYISHYPLGPRRHRRLPGHRPEVRQRHRPLAPAPHVRRLVVARRHALRSAAAPPRRRRTRPR